jgi:hypothetical protein
MKKRMQWTSTGSLTFYNKQMMMQDQDTQLDSISGTLHNLKDIAGTMHQEVEDHVVYVA